ncbi:hypothetical protein F5Y16DRAFT_411583 [Xylariaceae sp. FL0255]|nr:hypothetical protein F5Y16DRAFT_411583 [Xylariaceae sp. FL0255]
MSQETVYLGLWTNYDRGRLLGPTLTITSQQGSLLIAFTGFLIPFVASRFWKLMCVVLHHTYSTSESRSTIHHQRQVILRNSSAPDSGLISLLQLLWAWQTFAMKKDLYSRILPVVLLAIACITLFTAAGGLSSRIATSVGSQVLLKGNNCGIPVLVAEANVSSLSYGSQMGTDATNYAQQCYNSNSSATSLSCAGFVAQNLPPAVLNYSAACPFEEGMCRGNGTSLYLDTGYIDGGRHLGVNTPKNQGFEYRYVLQCSPLVTKGFTNTSITANNRSAVQYFYGEATLPLLASVTYQGTVSRELSEFTPSKNIMRQDGDVSLVFLSGNGVTFQEPLDDEWYRATTPGGKIFLDISNGSSQTDYWSSEAASPMGCVEQFQWCNTAYPKGSNRCGPLASFIDALYGAGPLFNVTAEELDEDRPSAPTATGTRLIWPSLILNGAGYGYRNMVVQANSLSSQGLLKEGLQLPLPLNQWQLDVTAWWNASLAYLQSSFVNTAIGTAPTTLTPINEQEKRLCDNQKILSNGYTSFNFFALLFTYATSGLIIVVSFITEPLLKFLSRRRKYRQYEVLEWTANESLQLHRLAQEGINVGHWTDVSGKVPVTESNDTLACLDISDVKHTVLSKPWEEEFKPSLSRQRDF